MGGLLLDGLGAAELGLGVDQLLRRKRGTAFLTLVAIGSLRAAFWAGTHNVAVCKEGLSLRVIVLLAFAGDELSLVVKPLEEFRSGFRVDLGRGPSIDVKVDSQSLEALLYNIVILVHDILGRAAKLTGLYGDWDTVLVAAAHVQHFLSAEAEIAYINVGRHVYSCKVSYVDGAVRVRKGTGNKRSLEVFIHILLHFFLDLFLGGLQFKNFCQNIVLGLAVSARKLCFKV